MQWRNFYDSQDIPSLSCFLSLDKALSQKYGSSVRVQCQRFCVDEKQTFMISVESNSMPDLMVDSKNQKSFSWFKQLPIFLQHYLKHSNVIMWYREYNSVEVTFISPAVQKIFGYDCEDFYQDPSFWLSKVHQDDHKQVSVLSLASCKKIDTNDCEKKMTYRVYDSSGGVRLINEVSYKVYDKQGRYLGVMGQMSEVSGLVKAQNDLLLGQGVQENMLAAKAFDAYVRERKVNIAQVSPLITALMSFVSSSDDVFWIMSHDYSRQLYVSPSLKHVWGYDAELFYLNPSLWLSRIHADDRERMMLAVASRKVSPTSGTVYEERYRIYTANNDIKHVYDKSFPLFDDNGELFAYAGIARDETAMVHNQEALLVEKKRAETALASRARFVAMISHELRTPLNGILGLSQLLHDDLAEEKNQSQIEDIQSSANHLLHIVNDLLDIAMMDENRISIREETFSIKRLFVELEQLVSSQLGPEVEFVGDIDELVPDWVIGDMNRIRQICQNYCSNAIKFTRSGSIRLSVHVVKEIGSCGGMVLRFGVKDTGPGISKKEQSFVFNEFYQAHQALSRSLKGVGLGLYICKAIAQALDGEVGLASEEGEGAYFWLDVPLRCARVHKSLLGTDSEAFFDASDMQVLVVEDHEINQKVIRYLLKNYQCTVKIASSGQEARDFCSDTQFDIIFMDVGLPDASGIDVAMSLRAGSPYYKTIPIIALTAHTSEEDQALYRDSKMFAFLPKPVDKEQLKLTMRRACEHVRTKIKSTIHV